jgi:hypothetical protein
VLVDLARTRRAGRRGAEPARVTIDEAADVLCHDDALTALAVLDERKSRIVELRFFGRLSLITARTSTRRISADRRRSRGPSKASA